MQSWIDEIAGHPGSRYGAIAATLTRAIHDGRIRPGERLPAQRDLADHLGVDLTTVTRAYGIVRDDGLIEGYGRLGSFVRNDVRAHPARTDSVGMNMPPQPASALLEDSLRRGTAALLRAGGATPLLQYQPVGGGRADRIAAATRLSGYGMPATDDSVIVTAGGQHALYAILALQIMHGREVVTGHHSYPGLLGGAARLGVRPVAIAADRDGLDPAALEQAAIAGARALYVVPTNDNPTAATMPIERRAAIVAVARRHGLTIIEDDAYGRLPSSPLPAIASMAPERTWHIASVSKIISPALRVAHVYAPSAEAAVALATAVHETSAMPPPLNVALVSMWLRDGTFDRLVTAVRAEAVARQRVVSRRLTGLDFRAHAEGYHLWLDTGDCLAPARIAEALRPTGLSAIPGDRFLVDQSRPSPFLRLSIGGAIGHERLGDALDALAATLRQAQQTALTRAG